MVNQSIATTLDVQPHIIQQLDVLYNEVVPALEGIKHRIIDMATRCGYNADPPNPTPEVDWNVMQYNSKLMIVIEEIRKVSDEIRQTLDGLEKII